LSTNLKILALDDTPLGDVGATAIAKSLLVNASVYILGLKKTGIGSAGIKV
jgi:hypothetical protein